MINVEQPSVTFRPAAFLAGTPGSRAGHLPFEYDLVAALKPTLIVELGVYFGDTYFGLCQAAAEQNIACTCYGVDTWLGDAETGLYDNTVFSAVQRYNDKRYRSFSHLVRKTFDEALPQFSDESIGLLHIDGLHSYEATKWDFEKWLPKVTQGGVMLLSDTAVRSSGYGVWKFWEELQRNYQTFSFRNNDGLGVLQKPGGHENVAFLQELLGASKPVQERIRRYYVLCAERLDFAEKAGSGSAVDGGQSVLQVHAQRGENYETDDGQRVVLEPGAWTNVSIRLPDGAGEAPLRIAPANRTAVVEISDVSLRTPNGETVWTWTGEDPLQELRVEGTASVLAAGKPLSILVYGTEPQIYLPQLEEPTHTEALELEMRVLVDPELAAVRDMSQKLSALQAEKRETAGRLEQSKEEHQVKLKQIIEDAEQRLSSIRDDFERQQIQMAVAFEEERKQHQATASLNAMAAQERAIARGNVEELQAEIERLNTLQTQLELDVVDLRKLNARMAAALEKERHARSSMEGSSSWQLTKPLRAVTDIFGPRKR